MQYQLDPLAPNGISKVITSVTYQTGGGSEGGAAWGGITGTLADQTDLQTALNSKIENLSSFDTDDLAEGTTNLYSQWNRFTDSGFNAITPNTATDQLVIGPITDFSKLSTFSDAKAVFADNAPTTFFIDQASGEGGFIQLGGVFGAVRSKGTLAVPTTLADGDIIRVDIGMGFDGTNYLTTADGKTLFGNYVIADTVTTGNIRQRFELMAGLGGTGLIRGNSNDQLGFFGTTPTARSTGWSVTNVTSDKTYDANSTTINELADVLGTLIDELKTKGLIGA
jgi:hypothetical protein